jgi:hypothetical protein
MPPKRVLIEGKLECLKCHEWLPAKPEYFSRNKNDKFGLASWCKKCFGAKEYKIHINYDTKSNISGYKKCSKCGNELPMTAEHFQRDNKNKTGFMSACKMCRKKYWADNRDALREYKRAHRLEHLEEHRQRQKEYYRLHPESRRKTAKKIRQNPNHRFATRVRSAIRMALRNGLKFHKTQEYLGCTIPEFKEYLISKFTDGMTWERFMNKEIEIDHRRPLSSFDLTDIKQQCEAFHYTNCQPLWRRDNRSKGSWYNGVNYNKRRY